MHFVGNREWISVMLSILSLMVVLFLNMKEENASYKIGWIILIMTLPVFGGLFYLLFGNKRPSGFMRLRLLRSHERIHPLLPKSKEVLDKLKKEFIEVKCEPLSKSETLVQMNRRSYLIEKLKENNSPLQESLEPVIVIKK